jgi:hypothetical protein
MSLVLHHRVDCRDRKLIVFIETSYSDLDGVAYEGNILTLLRGRFAEIADLDELGGKK